jgi:hypothetical protein
MKRCIANRSRVVHSADQDGFNREWHPSAPPLGEGYRLQATGTKARSAGRPRV